jgi:hypothetical protein
VKKLRFITQAYFISFMFASTSHTANTLELPCELMTIIIKNSSNLIDCVSLCRTNTFLSQFLHNDSIWEQLHVYIFHVDQKIFPELSYKENCKKWHQRPLVYGLIGEREMTFNKYTKTQQNSEINFDYQMEVPSKMDGNVPDTVYKTKLKKGEYLIQCAHILKSRSWQLAGALKEIIEIKPKIVYVLLEEVLGEQIPYGFHVDKESYDILKLSHKLDVLIIGYIRRYISSAGWDRNCYYFPKEDIHNIFPNMILVTAYYKSRKTHARKIGKYWQKGEDIDIAAPYWVGADTYGEPSQHYNDGLLHVVALAATMRAIRPELKAPDIRAIMIKAADRTLISKRKIPNGGFINFEAAISALEKW